MAKERLALGMLVAVLAFGFMVIGCPTKGDETGGGGGGPADGTWNRASDRLVISGSNWTWYDNGEPIQRGTVTLSGGNTGTFTWTLKEVYAGGSWRNQAYATGNGWDTEDFLPVTGSYQVTAEQLVIGNLGTFFK